MSEILHIKNFGPIKDVKLELKKVNILIGDQGTGKSTVAKLLAVIKEVLDHSEIKLFINGEDASKQQRTQFFEEKFKKNLEDYGITNYLKQDTYIEFKGSTNYFTYSGQNILVQTNPKQENSKNTRLISFIPAFREAAVFLRDDINAVFAVGVTLPQMFLYFGQNFSVAKKQKKVFNYKNILDIEYKFTGRDIIVLKSGDEIDISEASSAVNSLVPLLTVFDAATESMHSNNYRIYHYLNSPYIIIEEPELNCFPATQKKLMEYLISKLKIENETEYYCNLIIATHSPYILTSLNNLMYAYQVGNMESGVHRTAVSDIIPQQYWVNPDDVSCYLLKKDENGYSIHEDIKDKEGLIKSSMIDSVSRKLNTEFNEIINIEIGVAK